MLQIFIGYDPNETIAHHTLALHRFAWLQDAKIGALPAGVELAGRRVSE